MEWFRLHLTASLRQLVRKPGTSLAAVLISALGIGLSSAVFSLINGLLLRPLPVRAPEELVSIYGSTPEAFMAASALSTEEMLDLEERGKELLELAAYTYAPMTVEHGDAHRLVLGARTTAGFFSVLGIEAGLGRVFSAADDPEAAVAVVSDAAWRRRFGADPGLVGRSIRVNGRPVTVLGVAPPEFFGLTRGAAPELWLPMRLERSPRVGGARPAGWLWVLGRRAPGVSFAAARDGLVTLAARLAIDDPALWQGRSLSVLPSNTVRILPGVDSRLAAASLLLLGLVALVLLIACSNVANLLLARAAARQREMLTRRALGASAGAIVRQLMAESLLLALAGGALGILLVLATNGLLSRLELPLPVDLALDLALDVRVLAFSLAASALCAVLFGLAPALELARVDLARGLREGSPGSIGRRRRLAGGLVVAQLAASLVLVIATGLAARGLVAARRADPGFDPRGVAVATLAPRLQGYSPERSRELLDGLLDGARALPGVEAAALASHLPLTVEVLFEGVAAAESAERPERWPRVDSALVGSGYFEALRLPLLAGRTFDEGDRADGVSVAIVNQSLARRLWPGGAAVGRRLRVEGVAGELEVVGVVADGSYRFLGEAPRPFLYRALAQSEGRHGHTGEITSGSRTLVVRHRDAAVATRELRDLVRRHAPDLAVARLEPLQSTLGVTLFLPRAAAALFGALALAGLVLAMLGLYCLMVVLVRRRRFEIGVRLAVGATPHDVRSLVLGSSLRLVLAGVVLGLGLATLSMRGLGAMLHGIQAFDLAVYAGAAALLAVIALLASLGPAHAAARQPPAEILRGE